MLNKILVALDPQGYNVAVMEQAITLATATGAQLKLVSALSEYGEGGPLIFAHPGLTGYPPAIDEALWQSYQERYDAYAQKSLCSLGYWKSAAQSAGVSADIAQFSGHPGNVICTAAADWIADLIIVGNRGRRGVSEALLGSISNHVMHHAPCSVMVVHVHNLAKKRECKESEKGDTMDQFNSLGSLFKLTA